MENKWISRRQNVLNSMQENQVIIIFANELPHYPRHFLQEKNFYYLTGLEIPSAVLAIKKTKNKPLIYLFIERRIPEREVWDGKKMTPKEATEISGIENVKCLDEFSGIISSFFLYGSDCVYVNNIISAPGNLLNKQQQFIVQAKQNNPELCFKDMLPLIRPFRKIKDDSEIEELQKAIDATGAGINKIFKEAKAGMFEYELEAMLRYEINRRGLLHMGFKPIIAAGGNATTLHYDKNNCQVEQNELVLLDVGAACNNYSADITRTFPISGTFSPRQKEVYQHVLDVQKEIISMIKPGVAMTDLNKKTNELITEALKNLKLIKEDKEREKYYMHSIGHHLGLDTHDVGERDSVLEVGNVITIEPGIYIPEEAIGVRIEDDILVTENGYRNLSAGIPKEIAELEEICGK
jgi:Xaa-Pro aminopeptidase